MSAIEFIFSDSLKNEKNWTLTAFLFIVLSVYSWYHCKHMCMYRLLLRGTMPGMA